MKKNNYLKIIIVLRVLAITFLLTFFSCGKLEKLTNTDEFDFFNSDPDERELRRYTNEQPNNPWQKHIYQDSTHPKKNFAALLLDRL